MTCDSGRAEAGNPAAPASPSSESPRPMLTIGRFLDVSTGHLRFETCDRLGDYEGVLASPTASGWLMYVPQERPAQVAADHDWPEELLPIVRLALDRGCTYILFDVDGDRCDALPTWDW